MTEFIIPAITCSVVAFFTVYFMMPPLIHYLTKKNLTVRDIHKEGIVMIVRPGGPAIIAGILTSEMVLYSFFQINEILAIIFTSIIAFLVGYLDDKKARGGWFKPLGLTIAALPIIILGTFDSSLGFPLFGEVHIPILYLAIIIFMIVITGNTINSIDVANGIASGFMIIAGFSLSISLIIVQNYEIAIASLPLGFIAVAFYKYHKFPSKIFPGDSGALTLGAMYGTIAIIGHVEVIAAVALLPAILNSFLFLASVKKIVDHRELNEKPVELTSDFKIKATSNKKARVSLVRLIVAKTPLSEKDVAIVIFKLTLFSGILAIITAFLMEVKL